MNRIGIFVFYDSSGHVDEYVEVLLNSMSVILKKLIIVINGKIEDLDYKRLNKYSDNIFVRENRGYDAGAYKVVFTNFLNEEDWTKWDEIILFNDTFYGPLSPWEGIFKIMEKEEADFWGLSRHPGGGKLSSGEELPSHIQAYFLVCKKSLFLSSSWKEFWEALVYPGNYNEAIENFEVHFTEFFEERRYQGKAFTDKCRVNIEYGKNPYLCNFQELIQNFGFPIIKRRTICLAYLEKAKTVIDYLKNNTDYDINLIRIHIERLYREDKIEPIAPFDPAALERFYNRYEKVFIYGHGAYGKGIAVYFKYKGWEYEGFIVSENNGDEADVFVLRDLKFDGNSGIVMALGENAFFEIYPEIRKLLSESRLCCPQYAVITEKN